MADRHVWRQPSQHEDVKHQPAGDVDLEVEQREQQRAPVPLKGPNDPPSRAMIEAHNLTLLPAAPWC